MKRSFLRGAPAAILAVGSVLWLSPAFAHARLVKAVPAVGATVANASELRLQFDEDVELEFSSVAVKPQSGGAVEAAKPALEVSDSKTLVVKFATPLAAGVYDVEWKAVSADTHRTQGHFSFTVKP